MERANRIPQLDFLRGAAILLVLLFHYPYLPLVKDIGWIGVDLFFVLSGFLISCLLFSEWKRNSDIRIGRFYLRRGFKIYPSFYAFLAITSVLILPVELPRFLREVFFLQSYYRHIWGHTWSLAIEEHFYLVLPLVLLLLGKAKKLSWTPAISIALLFACGLLRVLAGNSTHLIGAMKLPTHLRIDGLFIGVALGYLFHFHNDLFHSLSRWWLLPLGLALLVPVAVYNERLSTYPWVLTANSLGFATILLFAATRHFRFPPLEKVGVYSYSIYLWHEPISMAFNGFGKPTLLKAIADFGLCLAAGVVAAEFIEFPALALRDRFFKRDETAPSNAAKSSGAFAEAG